VHEFAIEGDDLGAAETADTAAAQIGRIHAGRLDGFEQALIRLHVHLDTDRSRVASKASPVGGAANFS